MVDLLKKGRQGLCRMLEYALIGAVFVLVIDVLWGVFTRWSGSVVVWLADKGINAWSFIPRGQNEFTEEIARFLLVWIALLGSAVAFGEKAHLGVDYFAAKFHPSAQKLLLFVSQIIVLIFTLTIFMFGGTRIVMENMNQATPALGPAIGLKMGHVYLALPIAGIFIILFTLEQLFEAVLEKNEPREDM